MINWETGIPEDKSETVQLYNDENEEEDFECSKMLLVKHFDDSLEKETFSKAYYTPHNDMWMDSEGYQLFQVNGWYDMDVDINKEM